MAQKPPITDSPWFWFSLFAAVGLSALLATGGKFGKRQSNIERKYQARRWASQGGPFQADAQKDQADAAAEQELPEYSEPNKTLIRMKPMAVSIGLLLAGSLAMLVRERRRLAATESDDEHP